MTTTTTEEPDTARRLDRRQRLLDAFVATVGDRGCEHTRITEVCQAAGVSNRAFYATFSDKEECYLAAFDARADRVAEQATTAYRRTDGPFEERLRAGLNVIMATLAADPPYARFCTTEALRMGPAAIEHLHRAITRCQQALTTDDRRPHPPRTGLQELMVVGAVLQPVLAYVRDDKIDRLPELVPAFVSFLAHNVRRHTAVL